MVILEEKYSAKHFPANEVFVRLLVIFSLLTQDCIGLYMTLTALVLLGGHGNQQNEIVLL